MGVCKVLIILYSGGAGGIAARGQIYMDVPMCSRNTFANEIAAPVKSRTGRPPPVLRHRYDIHKTSTYLVSFNFCFVAFMSSLKKLFRN